MKKRIFLFSLIPLLFVNGPLLAGQIDPCNSTASISCAAMRISICPLGDFELFDAVCGASGDHIKIVIRDAMNNPVPGIPRTDYWLGACDPTYDLCLCCQPIIADAITDISGTAYICGTISGGGCVLNSGIYITVQGQTIMDQPTCISPTCLNIVIVSPDMTADCVINLSDLGVFAASYGSCPATDPCADFNDDNCVNLSDLALFAGHYMHECR
ncbi:MAG: hypothetical protein KOO63_13995 [Bacteroidales bacterium]|nr:hypothetical protein [Candidatus Latescibacterota bacterium]